MSPDGYYDTPEHRARLLTILAEWLGTPFVAHTARKGLGVDCVRFAAAVHHEAGALPEMPRWPRYPIYGGGDYDVARLCAELDLQSPMRDVTDHFRDGDQRVGDVLVFTTKRNMHHLGVMAEHGRFYHAAMGYGVITLTLEDARWNRRLHRVYRFPGGAA